MAEKHGRFTCSGDLEGDRDDEAHSDDCPLVRVFGKRGKRANGYPRFFQSTNRATTARQIQCFRFTCAKPQAVLCEGQQGLPDNSSTGVTKTVQINDNFISKEVTVCVDIDHTYRGDLVIEVRGPNGKTDTLWNKQGGSGDGIKECSGSRSFQNIPIKGIWRVKVADVASQDTGKWNSAEIRVTY